MLIVRKRKARTFDETVVKAHTFDEAVAKFNPYHGKDGRFTWAGSGGVAHVTINTRDKTKQHWADKSKEKAKYLHENKIPLKTIEVTRPGFDKKWEYYIMQDGSVRYRNDDGVLDIVDNPKMDTYEKLRAILDDGTNEVKVTNYKGNKDPKKEPEKPKEEPKKKSLDDCKTVAEVQDMMNSNGWFHYYYGAKATLDGVDLESAKAIYKSYEQTYDRFPQLKGEFAPIQTGTLGSNTYANCSLMSGTVTVNKTMYQDSAKVKKSYESDVASKWHPPGTDWTSVVTHEIGHAIDGYITRKGLVEGATFGNAWNKPKVASDILCKEVCKEAKTLVKNIGNDVSRYGATSKQEWFAECFAEYMTSPNPRPVAAAFGKKLEALLKGVENK